MRILFAGSNRHLKSPKQQQLFAKAGRELGRAAALLHREILIESDGESTLDRHVAEGARATSKAGGAFGPVIEVHRMSKHQPPFPEWKTGLTHVAYRADHDKNYRRLGARVGGLSGCDAAILMGGSSGTLLIGKLALDLRKPVLAIPCFGGAASELLDAQQAIYFQHKEYQHLIAHFQSWDHKRSAKAAMRMAALLARTHSYFVSYSHKHLEAADHFELMLTRVGRVFRRDEMELIPGKPIKPELTTLIAGADTFLALWSADAANSEWCHWERKTALALKAKGKPMRIVFVRLDNTNAPADFKNNLHLDGKTRTERILARQKLLDTELLE